MRGASCLPAAPLFISLPEANTSLLIQVLRFLLSVKDSSISFDAKRSGQKKTAVLCFSLVFCYLSPRAPCSRRTDHGVISPRENKRLAISSGPIGPLPKTCTMKRMGNRLSGQRGADCFSPSRSNDSEPRESLFHPRISQGSFLWNFLCLHKESGVIEIGRITDGE